MDASLTGREDVTIPSNPMGSVESISSSSSASPAAADIGQPGNSENVMITLSLTPDPPTTPSPGRLPFTRSHFRSRSLADPSSVPVMTRAHSSPGLDSRGRYIFVNGRGVPANMMDSTPKRYLPLQLPATDTLEPRMWQRKNVSETISEHAELDTSTGSSTPQLLDSHPPSSPVLSHTLPRMARRRPSSPLHFYPQIPSSQAASSPSFSHSPPAILSSRYNESFPGYSASSASSVPSTPTSLRSRSPSISSLETIPDIPDAEAEAIEADRIAALKAAADRADEADEAETANSTGRQRGTSDVSGPSTLASLRPGAYLIRADKRKRWSVCGAERRQDLDLETIWED